VHPPEGRPRITRRRCASQPWHRRPPPITVALPSWAGVDVDAQTITVIENEVRLVVPNTDMALRFVEDEWRTLDAVLGRPWEHTDERASLGRCPTGTRRGAHATGGSPAPARPAPEPELVPWLRQWHNDPDPATNTRLGDFFADFVTTEAATLGIAEADPRLAPSEESPPGSAPRQLDALAGKRGNPVTRVVSFP
jgi:hypothetical protein